MEKIEDIILRNTERPLRMTLFLVLPLVVGLTLLIAAFYLWDASSRHHFMELQFRETAKAHFDQILLTRLWNASHGGVYVEITDDTLPNPYLDDPEKNIVSINGKSYTKLNPAYMTRQLSELTDSKMAFKIHLSGANPKNPANKPDEWEALMISSFREGKEEGYEMTESAGEEYFRYMAPLVVQEECMGCHGGEGYSVGDVKGGISIKIPAGFLTDLHEDLDWKSIFAFSTIAIFTTALLVGVTWISSKRLGESLRKELENERLAAAVKIAAAAAHELRQPLTVISGFSELLKDRLEKGDDINVEADIIVSQCKRMDDIITRMLNVTAYKTKAFGDESEIFDLGLKSGEEKDVTTPRARG